MTKNILITGASKGLGLELVCQLMQVNAYKVYCISRSMSPELEKLRKENEGRTKWLCLDLGGDIDYRKEIFDEFVGKDVPLHGLVNNAAFAYDDIATNAQLSSLLHMFKVNTFAPMFLTKYFLRHMLLNRNKVSIIHISSISVHTGYKGLSMYAASKGALEAYSKNISREWGEKGVRSNTIVAGFMETNMSSTLSSEQKDRIYKRNSLKVPTTLESVASTIIFLLGEASNSITGQNLHVDSGTI